MKEKLSILWLASWYPSKAHGTLGNFVQRHAEAVATLHQVQVLYTTSLPGLATPYQTEVFEKNGVQTLIVYYRSDALRWWRKWRAFSKGVSILKQENGFRFNLVHLNVIWPAGWQALYIKRKFKIPFVVTEHWTGYDVGQRNDPGRKIRMLAKRTAGEAAMMLPVTANLGHTMRNFGLRGNYSVVPNVVDTSIFSVGTKHHNVTKFLHVSSLVNDQKNIAGLLRAWHLLTQKRKDIHLSIGGDGSWQPYEKLLAQLNIGQETISFFTEKSLEQIAAMMKESHALVLFSNYENFPCVIAEALASGMAIISTDVGGISEQIDATRGYLIARRDENALADAMFRFCDEKKNFDPHALRKYAVEHFNIESVARQFDKVYDHVIQSHIKI